MTVAGTKGHRGRAYKFKESTTEMLRTYMAKHQNKTHPFPDPAVMADAWREARSRAALKTGKQSLNKIPLKGLRNLSGIIAHQETKDPWTVMFHMGHKKTRHNPTLPISHETILYKRRRKRIHNQSS